MASCGEPAAHPLLPATATRARTQPRRSRAACHQTKLSAQHGIIISNHYAASSHDGVNGVSDLDDVLSLLVLRGEAVEPLVGVTDSVLPHRLVQLLTESRACREYGRLAFIQLTSPERSAGRGSTRLRPCGACASRRRWWRPGWDRTIRAPKQTRASAHGSRSGVVRSSIDDSRRRT